MDTQDEHLTRLAGALEDMAAAARDNAARSLEIQERAQGLLSSLESGVSLVDHVRDEPRPLMVELVSANMAALETAGARLRAAQATALRAEGLTIEAIAELFGVTRQRISALLKQKAAAEL